MHCCLEQVWYQPMVRGRVSWKLPPQLSVLKIVVLHYRSKKIKCFKCLCHPTKKYIIYGIKTHYNAKYTRISAKIRTTIWHKNLSTQGWILCITCRAPHPNICMTQGEEPEANGSLEVEAVQDFVVSAVNAMWGPQSHRASQEVQDCCVIADWRWEGLEYMPRLTLSLVSGVF